MPAIIPGPVAHLDPQHHRALMNVQYGHSLHRAVHLLRLLISAHRDAVWHDGQQHAARLIEGRIICGRLDQQQPVVSE